MESADVGVEIRIAREAEAESGRNLLPEHLPLRIDVTRPCVRACALEAGEAAARHDRHAAASVRLVCALVVVDSADGHEREEVAHTAVAAEESRRVEALLRVRPVVRLGGVHPPRVDSAVNETAHVLPVEVARGGVERVVDNHALVARPCHEVLEVPAAVLEILVGLRVRTEVRPERDHELRIAVVDGLHARLGIVLESVGDEIKRIPVLVSAPVLPVLHDAVHRDAALPVLIDNLRELRPACVALAAHVVAESPLGGHRHLAGEPAYLTHHAVRSASVHEVVVARIAYLARVGHDSVQLLVFCDGRAVDEDSPSLDGLKHGRIVLYVVLQNLLRNAAA